jgi:cellulose synthase/poly-beta-1,6-N-acetylglucosamine synthase-like glycosyltransferase
MNLILASLYVLVIVLLGIYLYRITILSIHARMHDQRMVEATVIETFPFVTVHLPVYNEKDVVERLIDAVCSMDYPRDRLQIQVLDDSTDVTTSLIAQCAAKWKERGLMIEHIRRPDRRGHKAGNLAHALPLARGEFIAIFDADFIPAREWLMHTISHFFHPNGERLGLVQTRWSHLNAADSALTYAQDLAVHQFAIAQSTRSRINLWSSFYGSAGLWRKNCLIEAGGWSADTFSEDLDMAYRAQLHGWRIDYDARIFAAAELPPSMLAYKQQQFFWSKGNIQVVRILWKRMQNSTISWLQHMDALLFATWPLNYVLLLSLTFIQILTLFFSISHIKVLDFIALCVVSSSTIPPLMDALQGKPQIPLHLPLMTGISVNMTAGFFSGIFSPIREQARATTPRSANAGRLQLRRSPLLQTTILELVLTGLCLLGCFIAFQHGRWWLMIVLSGCVLGYGWVGTQSLFEISQAYFHRQIENADNAA